ncbi:MAG: putative S-layer protein [Candidatus Pacearchaeota archaeon]|nr:putative S-layer protein [Candidatus Pacearchaeota archaeon]
MKVISKLVFIGILMVVILSITLIGAAITNINLVSPANGAWINDISPVFTFSARSTIDPVFVCSLNIDGGIVATNTSVLNNTNTNISPPLPLSQGTHTWFISCVDSEGVPLNSITRTVYVDSENPVVELIGPVDGFETQEREVDFKFKVTDNLDTQMECTLYLDGDDVKTSGVNNNTQTTWTITDLERDEHTWYVKCEDNAKNSHTSPTWDFKILEVGYCVSGEQGTDLSLVLEKPESNDEFYVGEDIEIEVEVENSGTEDLDIVVKAELYDLDGEDDIVTNKVEDTVEEDETKTITLKLRIPSTADEDHDHVVNVKVYEKGAEDEQCKEDSVDVVIEKKEHDISIKDLLLNPSTVECSKSFNLNFNIENTGREDENIKIYVYSSPLKINISKTLGLDSGEDYSDSLLLTVPKNIQEGNYIIDFIVYYDYYDNSYHDSTSGDLQITVRGNCLPPEHRDVSFTASPLGDAFVGREFTTRLMVTNTGNVDSTYSITAKDYSEWATLVRVDPGTLTLGEGEVGYSYVVLKPLENATGARSFKVQVKFENVTKEQIVTVDVKHASEAATAWEQFLFEVRRNWVWALFNLILIAVIIILLISLIKQKRSKARPRPSATEIRLRQFEPEWKPKKRK